MVWSEQNSVSGMKVHILKVTNSKLSVLDPWVGLFDNKDSMHDSFEALPLFGSWSAPCVLQIGSF